ncbi:DNA-directed RNA polymerase III subunit 1-like [Papaver somniferum]|uniref:DNA-directed RNA polymerase III subunit 1-like n=1 Tax=Papaver somniferum TaxID=3469 RepID=UPI000E6FA919|nr:DNA-directed RNA polymerase III subunit 1-like [Papaver somniferum]
MATTTGQSEAQAQFQFTKQPYVEDVGPRKIQSIKFSMMSGPEIMKASEVQVCNASFYDPNRKPKRNALLDSRMGPANKTIICETCHGELKDCPGHYGYLHLCLPVFNVGYFNAILNILKCICKSCARILLSKKERISYLKKMRNPKPEALQKTATAKAILKSCKPKTCSRCGYVNAVVKKAGTVMGIIHDRSKKFTDDTDKECKAALSGTKDSGTRIQILNPVRVLGLFKRILDQDCELLYLSVRPEKLIITDILVPPIAVRPSSFVDGGRSNEDDITSKLNTIIQTNASLRQDLDGKKSTSQCLGDWELLQVEVAQYINSEVRGVPLSMMQPSKPLRGFVQRLKGKQGRFRGNLCGKRVEYTARTVISPDPNLKITEVGIPILIAQTLTYPELVSQHNIEKLRKCVLNGAQKYPGAKSIKSADGSMMFQLNRNQKNLAYGLKFGDIVERHLEDGDVVLFNRQPSLHRMSIMCHRVFASTSFLNVTLCLICFSLFSSPHDAPSRCDDI